MAEFDPGERRASTLGCAAGIGGVAVVIFALAAALIAAAIWLWK